MSYRKISFTIFLITMITCAILVDMGLIQNFQAGKTLFMMVILHGAVCAYKKEDE